MRFVRTNRNRWRFLRDAQTVSYHPSSGRPDRSRAAPTRHRRSGQPDHGRPDHALRSGADPLGRAPDADTRGALFARPSSRCTQPAFEGDAPLHEGIDGVVGHLLQGASQRRLPLHRRRGHRKGVCQEALLGGVDVLVCQEAQGLRVAHSRRALVQLRRSPSHPRGLPLVAAQALVRATPLPDQAQAGGGDAQGGCRFGAAPQIHRLRHPLQRGVVHQDGGKTAAYLGGNVAPSDDRPLARQAAIRRRVGQDAGSEVAQAPRDARRSPQRLRSQVRLLAVGRDQKPSRQLRLHRHQRLGSGPHHGGFAQGAPLVHRDAFPRRQAVCGIGGVPMPGGSGDGSTRRPRSSHLCGIADDAPIRGGELGLGQGALAVGGDARWRISSSTPQGLSTSSTSHRVSPVIEQGIGLGKCGGVALNPTGAYPLSCRSRGRRGGSSAVFNLVPGVFAIFLFVLVSVAGLVLVQRMVPVELRKQHNDVAGFIYAVLGIAYAVLLGLVVVAAWEQFQTARNTTEREASELAEVFWLGHRLPEAEGHRLQELARSYARVVMDEEWPLIARGGSSPRAWELMDEIRLTIQNMNPDTEAEQVLYYQGLERVYDLADARRDRLLDAREGIPPILWSFWWWE